MKRPDPNHGIVPIADLVREEIEYAVAVLDGNLRLAAKLLGMTVATLRRHLRQYGNPRVLANGYQIRGARERRERDVGNAAA